MFSEEANHRLWVRRGGASGQQTLSAFGGAIRYALMIPKSGPRRENGEPWLVPVRLFRKAIMRTTRSGIAHDSIIGSNDSSYGAFKTQKTYSVQYSIQYNNEMFSILHMSCRLLYGLIGSNKGRGDFKGRSLLFGKLSINSCSGISYFERNLIFPTGWLPTHDNSVLHLFRTLG